MNRLFDGREFSDRSFSTSPVTGLTRDHWIAVADHLLSASEGVAGPDPWHFEYPGKRSVNGIAMDGLEGFARTLLLGSFRIAAGSIGADHAWIDQLRAGIDGGAQALAEGNEAAWPGLEASSQALVEAASIATALSLASEHLWRPLSGPAQQALIKWFRGALVRRTHVNNWVFFPATIAAALELLGHGDRNSNRVLTRLPELIRPWYLSGGWYSDGPGTRIDYYNAWSYHYYLPLIAYLTGRQELVKLARERIQDFLKVFPLFFDSEGAPIFFGRSLTYRFGSLAPFWTAQLVGTKGLASGALRAVASTALHYFVRNDAMADGTLSVGWLGKNDEVAQPYSSAASPLWSAKAFIGLLLGPSHPAWTAHETTEVEPRTSSALQLTPASGFLVSRSRPEGVSRLHLGGISEWPDWSPQSRVIDPLYGRLAYSSATAPYSGADSPENTVFVTARGVRAHPAPSQRTRVGEGWISWTSHLWAPVQRRFPPTYRWGRATRVTKRLFAPEPWRAARLSVLTVTYDDEEIRVYLIRHAPPGAEMTIGFFAVPEAKEIRHETELPTLSLRGNRCNQDITLLTRGWELATVLRPDRSNPFGEMVTIPAASTVANHAGFAVLGAVLRLTRDEQYGSDMTNIRAMHDGGVLTVVGTKERRNFTVDLRERILRPRRWSPLRSEGSSP